MNKITRKNAISTWPLAFMFLVLVAIAFSGCVKGSVCGYKDQNVSASAAEIAYLQQYFASAGITNVTQHSSGVFYTVNTPGTGLTPNLCSNVTVNYSAYRLGVATSFNSYTDPNGIRLLLGQLIVGIQKTLPQIKEGGSITMYIPPSLGYGSSVQQDANGTIILPANSYLKFDMNILSVL